MNILLRGTNYSQNGIKNERTGSGNISSNMGWYTTYEVEFYECSDWDVEAAKKYLTSVNVEYLYLRDLDTPRIVLCVYSQTPVEEILVVLKYLYSCSIRYRRYTTDEWIVFTDIIR